MQRLKHTYNYFNTGNDYTSVTSATLTGLRELVSYDANGNISSLQRFDDNATTPALMDDFVYRYNGNTNRLNYVIDNVSTPGISTDRETQSANNYAYDEIGQLTADNISGITNIVWNVRNKPTRITESGKEIYFEYDEMGHRIKKEVQSGSENNWTQQWYVLDPQGNPVAVYEHKYTNPGGGTTYNEIFDLEEHQIYGSDRLGTRQYSNYELWKASFTCSSFNVDHTFHNPSGKTNIPIAASSYLQNRRITGNKYYELKNHTNNVQAVITDYKKPYAASCSGITNVDYYTADVKSYTDYFVFGGTMNNRFTGGNAYRYGFQGQERDNEIKGDDNSINFEFRMHDPQYGRFLSIDPLAAKYPHNSPYAFSENRLIDGIELEGLEYSRLWKAAGIGEYTDKNGNNTGQAEWQFLENTRKQWWEASKPYLKIAAIGYAGFIGGIAAIEIVPAYIVYLGFGSSATATTTSGLTFTPTINYATTYSLWPNVLGASGTGIGVTAATSPFWQTATNYFGLRLSGVATDYTLQYAITGEVDITSGLKYFNPGAGLTLDLAYDVKYNGKKISFNTALEKKPEQLFFEGLNGVLGYGSSKYFEKSIFYGTEEGLEKEFMKGLTDQTINAYTIGGQELVPKPKEP